MRVSGITYPRTRTIQKITYHRISNEKRQQWRMDTHNILKIQKKATRALEKNSKGQTTKTKEGKKQLEVHWDSQKTQLRKPSQSISFTMPQEIQLWIVLPALKRQLSIELVKTHKLKQKTVATMLNITPAAISQYLSGKRGNSLAFSKPITQAISQKAIAIVNKKVDTAMALIELLQHPEIKQLVCQLHKKMNPTFSNCSYQKNPPC